jgi:simple sugar transport system ATP-binding protein
LVIGSGKITGLVDARTATKEQIGLLMTKTEPMETTEGGDTHG